MLRIPGYEVGEAFFESEGFRLHRGRKIDGPPVVLKILSSGNPTPVETEALSREHALLVKMEMPGVLRAIALEHHERVWALVLEDFGAAAGAIEERLRTTQSQLVQSEKMASLGRLTMGVAHEIKNPLNFVNNFAKLSVELCDELDQALVESPDARLGDVTDIVADLKLNATKICEHGTRADEIVRSMLRHTGGGAGERRTVDLNALVDDFVRLASQGAKARQGKVEVKIEQDYDKTAGHVTVVPQEIGRVIVNLLDNAIDSVLSRARTAGPPYKPTIKTSTRRTATGFEIRIGDNGTGIPEAIRARVFEPFFTTKPPGQGTGLGLSLSHDVVVSGHGGKLGFESAVGEGTTFVISIPAEPLSIR